MVVNLEVSAPQELFPQIFWQFGLHLILNGNNSLLLLEVVMLQVVPHVVLNIHIDFEVIHEGRIEDKL
jgi:hypothetical protein